MPPARVEMGARTRNRGAAASPRVRATTRAQLSGSTGARVATRSVHLAVSGPCTEGRSARPLRPPACAEMGVRTRNRGAVASPCDRGTRRGWLAASTNARRAHAAHFFFVQVGCAHACPPPWRNGLLGFNGSTWWASAATRRKAQPRGGGAPSTHGTRPLDFVGVGGAFGLVRWGGVVGASASQKGRGFVSTSPLSGGASICRPS